MAVNIPVYMFVPDRLREVTAISRAAALPDLSYASTGSIVNRKVVATLLIHQVRSWHTKKIYRAKKHTDICYFMIIEYVLTCKQGLRGTNPSHVYCCQHQM